MKARAATSPDPDLEALAEQLAEARAEGERLAERLADREARTLQLEEAAGELRHKLEQAHTAQREAVSRYRAALLAAAPELPAHLVQGETLEQLDAALAQARATVEHVRATIAQQEPRPIPAGSPTRSGPDLAAMSPTEKIRHGLAQR